MEALMGRYEKLAVEHAAALRGYELLLRYLLELVEAGECPRSVGDNLLEWVQRYLAEHELPAESLAAVQRDWLDPSIATEQASSAEEGSLGALSEPIMLEIPEEVKRLVTEHEVRSGEPLSVEGRQLFEASLALQYHFGGKQVLYRDRPEGREICAVGSEDCAAFARDRIPEDQFDQYRVEEPSPWPLPR